MIKTNWIVIFLSKKAFRSFLCFFLLQIFSGCVNDADQEFRELSFIKTDSIIIELPFNHSASISMNAYKRGDTNFLLLADINQARMVELDMDNQKVSHVIDIHSLKNDFSPIFLFHYHNEDSILILRDRANTMLNHDSVLFYINLLGQVTGYVNMKESTLKVTYEEVDSSTTLYGHNFQAFPLHKNRLFIYHSSVYFNPRKTEKFKQFNIPILSYIDLIHKNSQLIPISLDQDVILYADKHLAYEQYNIRLLPMSKDKLFIFSGYDKEPICINPSTGKRIPLYSENTYYIAQSPIELPESQKSTQYNSKSFVFTDMIYDSLHSSIIRFGYFPAKEGLSKDAFHKYRNQHQWVGIYDTNHRLLAEGVKPRWFKKSWPTPISVGNKLLMVEKDENQIKIIFVETQIKKSTKERMKILRESHMLFSEDEEIKPYTLFTEYYKIKENSRIIMVPAGACPFCVNYAMDYYVQNIEKMEAENIYLLVEESHLTKGLRDLHSPYIIFDDKNGMSHFLDISSVNPSILYWNGKQVTRQIEMPPSVVKNINEILEEYGEF